MMKFMSKAVQIIFLLLGCFAVFMMIKIGDTNPSMRAAWFVISIVSFVSNSIVVVIEVAVKEIKDYINNKIKK